MLIELIKSRYSAIILIIISGVVLSPCLFNYNPLGIPLLLFGAVIYFRSRQMMGRTWSIEIEPKDKLITKGLFRHIRHPLYTGVLIACTGLMISTLSPYFILLCAGIIFPYIYARARIEEELLKMTLPDYDSYMKMTSMFVPKVI